MIMMSYIITDYRGTLLQRQPRPPMPTQQLWVRRTTQNEKEKRAALILLLSFLLFLHLFLSFIVCLLVYCGRFLSQFLCVGCLCLRPALRGMRFSCGRLSLQNIDTGCMSQELASMCLYTLQVEPKWLHVVAIDVDVLVLFFWLIFYCQTETI